VVKGVNATSVVLELDQPPMVGCRIHSFTVEISNAKQSYNRAEKFGRVDDSPNIFHITNLIPGNLYTFRSRAENIVGFGPYSDWSDEVLLPHIAVAPTTIADDDGRASLLSTQKPSGLGDLDNGTDGGSGQPGLGSRGYRDALGTVTKMSNVLTAHEKYEEDETYDSFNAPTGEASVRVGFDLPSSKKGKFSAKKPIRKTVGEDYT
jgi:hypothetical protein